MPAPTLITGVRQFLKQHAPFSHMRDEDVEFAAARLTLEYFAQGELILGPESGPPAACYLVKQGLVAGERRPGPGVTDHRSPGEPTVQLAAGDLFSTTALLANRPVSTVYRALGDTFCWRLAKEDFDALTHRSPVFLDFCRDRMAALLDLSSAALQASYATQNNQSRALEAPLQTLIRRAPVLLGPAATLHDAFVLMERERVGSVLITEPRPDDAPAVGQGHSLLGIFTRQDVIGRVSLPGLPLHTPVREVMTAPVMTLPAEAPIAQAMLLMARQNIRHVPLLREGRVVGIVTERDLFQVQRLSLRRIGDTINAATSVTSLPQSAADIRAFSESLVAQGMSAGIVTSLISRLNDQLTVRILELEAARHAIDLGTLCWIAMGSEGREEQTIATDQDNGLILSDAHAHDQERVLAFARDANNTLDRCGYPLCKGGIMAGNPQWCLSASGWAAQFSRWIERGDPQALLGASIFFDFRALAGDSALAVSLREQVTRAARNNTRFLKQMSDSALRNGPPAAWRSNLLDQLFAPSGEALDLKLHGTAPFVEAARVLALAQGVAVTNTVERFEALVGTGQFREEEVRAWIDAFQFLQALRLRVQHRHRGAPPPNPNLLEPATISLLDRRILKQVFVQLERLQQRLALDYP